ncbi:MAG: menaquinone biosynthetic enzyme MqnA/MqnD family protein [Armatimonadota bacterium]
MCDGCSEVRQWRLGVVSYLNSVPLAWGLTTGPDASRVQAVKDVPARLAEYLHGGGLDAAIVSSIECFRNAGVSVLRGLGIAATGEILSIRLFSSRELTRVVKVALDSSSRSAAALTRVLFAELYGTSPRFVRRQPDLDAMLSECDAALLIGDTALQTEAPRGVDVYDLGREWYKLTGLPFVYALWGGKQECFETGLGELLWRSWEYGMDHLDDIALAESDRLGVSRELCESYLGQVITYKLGEPEEEGLYRFLELAAKHELVGPVPRSRVMIAGRTVS